MSKKKRPPTHIAIVLDASGSMAGIRDETISLFNQQAATIREKAKKQDIKVSLVTFSSTVDKPIYWMASADKVKDITKEDYIPNGGTALLDAMGGTIAKLTEDESHKEANFILAVISDGDENASVRYSYDALRHIIKERQATERWTISLLGANLDIDTFIKRTGMLASNSARYYSTGSGTRAGGQCVNSAISNKFDDLERGAYSSKGFYNSSEIVTEVPDKEEKKK